MKDTADSQTPSTPVPLIVPEVRKESADAKNFDPKFLEAVETVFKENDELLKRLAS
jgi:hypothetical protein